MSFDAIVATFNLSKSQVTPSEKYLLLACANRTGATHECWPSVERLCADTGFDRKTVIKTRKSLIAKNLMTYDAEKKKGKSGQIRLMRLTYVSHETVDNPNNSVDKSKKYNPNNTKSGTPKTPNSTRSGTSDSATSGTQNLEDETINKRATTTTSVNQKEERVAKNKNGSDLTYIDDNFKPDDASLKKLYEASEQKKIDTVELQEKFIDVSKRYKTRSSDWQTRRNSMP